MCTAGTCGLAMCATRLMPVAKKLRILARAVDRLGEIALEGAADGRDVDADLLEHLALHHAAHAAAAGLARRIGAVPRRYSRSARRDPPRARSPRTRRRSGRAALRTRRARRPVAGRRVRSFGQSSGLPQRFGRARCPPRPRHSRIGSPAASEFAPRDRRGAWTSAGTPRAFRAEQQHIVRLEPQPGRGGVAAARRQQHDPARRRCAAKASQSAWRRTSACAGIIHPGARQRAVAPGKAHGSIRSTPTPRQAASRRIVPTLPAISG